MVQDPSQTNLIIKHWQLSPLFLLSLPLSLSLSLSLVLFLFLFLFLSLPLPISLALVIISFFHDTVDRNCPFPLSYFLPGEAADPNRRALASRLWSVANRCCLNPPIVSDVCLSTPPCPSVRRVWPSSRPCRADSVGRSGGGQEVVTADTGRHKGW